MHEPVTLNILYAMPIPVGHRVEVHVFAAAASMFQGVEPVPSQPLVRGLETGIIYGAGWHYEDVSVYVPHQVRPLPLHPRRDLQVPYAPLVGRVLACRIAAIGAGKGQYQQTTLVVEPLPPEQVYR